MALILDDKYPEVPATLARLADEILTTNGIDPQKAGVLAMRIAEAARHEFGGTTPYWPKSYNPQLLERDKALYARFNGRNYHELAKSSGLCEMRIRQIIERFRAADRATRQQDFFPEDL